MLKTITLQPLESSRAFLTSSTKAAFEKGLFKQIFGKNRSDITKLFKNLAPDFRNLFTDIWEILATDSR